MKLNLRIYFMSETSDPELSQKYKAIYNMVANATKTADFGTSVLGQELFQYFPQVEEISINLWAATTGTFPQITFNELPVILFVNEDTSELISLLRYPFSPYIIQRAIQFSFVEILKKAHFETDGFHSYDPLFKLLPVQGDESVVFHGLAIPIIPPNSDGGLLDEILRNSEYWWIKNKEIIKAVGVLAGLGIGAYLLAGAGLGASKLHKKGKKNG